MQNFIMIWSGAVVDIPPGWQLCDGSNGTPDLRGKVVIGAGGVLNPGYESTTTLTNDSFWSVHALCYIMKL